MRRPRISNTLAPKGVQLPPGEFDSPLEHDPILRYQVTVGEAERLVRLNRGRTFSVHTRQFAPNKVQPEGREEGAMMGRDVSSYINVSKRDALRFIDSAYGRVRDTHVMRVSLCSTCFFIG